MYPSHRSVQRSGGRKKYEGPRTIKTGVLEVVYTGGVDEIIDGSRSPIRVAHVALERYGVEFGRATNEPPLIQTGSHAVLSVGGEDVDVVVAS